VVTSAGFATAFECPPTLLIVLSNEISTDQALNAITLRLMRASDQDGARPRRRGRPRVVPSASGEDPRTEILAAAATLIARNGLSGASTRLIAAEAGLQQPSVFYYFPSKDAIIGELLDQVVEPTLQMLGRIQRARAPASVSLFALTYYDTWNMACTERNRGLIRVLPELRRERFPAYWRKVESLYRAYHDIVAAGQDAGVFRQGDAGVIASLIGSIVERAASLAAADSKLANEQLVDEVVHAAMRTTLVRVSSLPKIEREGRALLEMNDGLSAP